MRKHDSLPEHPSQVGEGDWLTHGSFGPVSFQLHSGLLGADVEPCCCLPGAGGFPGGFPGGVPGGMPNFEAFLNDPELLMAMKVT